MKKILICSFIFLSLVTGCGKNEKTNTDSKIVKAKNEMLSDLSNYSYDVEITAKTNFMDATTTMKCKDDLKNKIGYCTSSTYGVTTEDYYDYNNKTMYSKVSLPFGYGDSDEWTKSNYGGNGNNTWLDLNDYIFDVKEESKDGGVYYTGVIDSKKLANAMSQADSEVDTSSIVSGDIDIEVFVNSSNYIEYMKFNLVIAGIEEVVEISYYDYNETGSIEIPNNIK